MSPDLLIAIAQAVLTGNALLMLANVSTYVSRTTSMSMALALVLLTVGLLMLSAPISAAVVAVCAAAWLGIFALRGSRIGRAMAVGRKRKRT